MTPSRASQPAFTRTWLLWIAGFIAFPLAGLAGAAAAGEVDSPYAALLGGLVTGLVLGAGQALASRRRLDPRRWIPATGVGMGIGLLLGAAVVDYGTSLLDLVLMGALTGVVLGPVQALALPRQACLRWVWAAAMPALWALGWAVTALGQIHVEQQFTIFGAYGAVTVSALSGLLLHRLLPYRTAADQTPEYTRNRSDGMTTEEHVTYGTVSQPSGRSDAGASATDSSAVPATRSCPTTLKSSKVTPAIPASLPQLPGGRLHR